MAVKQGDNVKIPGGGTGKVKSTRTRDDGVVIARVRIDGPYGSLLVLPLDELAEVKNQATGLTTAKAEKDSPKDEVRT